MHIDYLEEFIELARSLNYSKASRKLHMTPSTLSRHIAQLEENIGAPLFKRTTRSVELTEAGQFLCVRIQPIVAAYHAAMGDMARFLNEENVVLRIAFPYYFADRYLQPELDRFAKEHPDAHISLIPIQPENGEQMLLDDECDVAFDIVYPSVAPNPNFIGRIVGLERFCVCMPKSHRLARRKQIAPSDLASCTIIKSVGYPRYNAFVDRLLEEPAKTVTASSIELVYATALQHNAVEVRIATSGMQEKPGITYVPLTSDLSAKIRLVRLDTCENPLAKLFV